MESVEPMGSAALQATVERLCRASRAQDSDPHARVAGWPARLDEGAGWFTAPELVSLHGTPIWEALDDAGRRRLAFREAVNFYSLNIHGERLLVEGLARRLYRRDSAGIDPYLHHVLDEENAHLVYFGTFCTRYGGGVYPSRQLAFPREHAPGEEDLLFFAQVLVFEEIVDAYNVQMALDARLHPVAREINALHHRDEARHLVFGRRLVRELLEQHASAWDGETLRGVREQLAGFFLATWKAYYNPDVYRDAGLPGNPHRLTAAAFDHPACRAHRRRASARAVGFLVQHGLLDKEPEP